MSQYEGLSIPFSGDSDAKTSGNAYWLQTLRRAALGRNNQTLPQDPAKTGIILKNLDTDIPAWSLIGAKGATYPPSPTSEPTPYLQATLEDSDILLYVKQAYTAASEYIEGFAFLPDDPVRILVDPSDPDYDANYVPGSPVGRLADTDYLSKGGSGLILVSVPYTEDGGLTYYAWVVGELISGQRKRVIIIGDLSAPVGATPTTGLAAGLDYDPTTHAISANSNRYPFFNFDPALSAVDGTFAKIEIVEGLWDIYWVGCAASEGFTGLPEEPEV